MVFKRNNVSCFEVIAMPIHFDDNPLVAYFKNADGRYTPLGGIESITMSVDSDSPNVSGVDLSAWMTELSASFRWRMPRISRKRFIK